MGDLEIMMSVFMSCFAIALTIVCFFVYRTWGPVYRAVVTVSVKTPLGSMQPEERYEVTEKGVLKQYISRNSLFP